MASKYWGFFLLLLGRSVCYENLCRRQDVKVSQSSDREEGLPATKAVDGSYSQNYKSCAHTAPRKSIAWFQVDLRKPYRLNSVKTFYRNDDFKPYRFRQFYLDVSNTSADVSTTLTQQRVRCYKDNTTDQEIPSAVIDIPCSQTAQYVIIETTYNAPENRDETGPMLEICEIEIYGCSTECFGNTCYSNGDCHTCGGGHWGKSCQNNCPSQCNNGSCDKYNGTCNRGCKRGFGGNDCTIRCSDHCLNDICDFDNETCVNGCKTYFTGTTCQTMKQASERSTNTDIYSALYGVLTVLFISICLNIFFIVRNVRQTIYRSQNSKNVNKQHNLTKNANTAISDIVEYNAGYQELGQLSQPSHYDELR